jgi:hypothetical protein
MYLPFHSPDQIAQALRARMGDVVHPWLLCLADRHGEQLPELLAACRDQGLRVAGGLFPGLIHGASALDRGLIAQALPADSQISVAQLQPEGVVWRDLPAPLPPGPASTLILADCLAPGIARLLEDIYDRYGNHIRHAGAGAGYHDLRPAPSIFTETGLTPHGALLILIPRRATVQVRHGWRRVRGPFVASRTRANQIQELNWEPAGVFYLAQVAELAPQLRGRPVFPDLNSTYPLCIGREGGEDVMRDPMRINAEGAVEVLSDVAENAVMYLAHGDRDTVVEAARQAVEECGAPADVAACFISDCYSRALMLGDEFPRELAAVQQALAGFTDLPAEGVLALGEIAANGRRNLEFYNKTFVVALAHAAA